MLLSHLKVHWLTKVNKCHKLLSGSSPPPSPPTTIQCSAQSLSDGVINVYVLSCKHLPSPYNPFVKPGFSFSFVADQPTCQKQNTARRRRRGRMFCGRNTKALDTSAVHAKKCYITQRELCVHFTSCANSIDKRTSFGAVLYRPHGLIYIKY